MFKSEIGLVGGTDFPLKNIFNFIKMLPQALNKGVHFLFGYEAFNLTIFDVFQESFVRYHFISVLVRLFREVVLEYGFLYFKVLSEASIVSLFNFPAHLVLLRRWILHISFLLLKNICQF